MVGTLLVSGQEIIYTIVKSERAKQVRIDVLHSGEVKVTVPRRISFRQAHMFAHTKRHWIAKSLEHYRINTKKLDTSGWEQPSYHACKGQAQKLVRARIVHYNDHYNFSFNRISVRNQKSKWGSCSSEGNLNFNYKILFLPEHLCDYVVVHELCHLKELNHSHRFWSLVKQRVEDYKKRRYELKKYLP